MYLTVCYCCYIHVCMYICMYIITKSKENKYVHAKSRKKIMFKINNHIKILRAFHILQYNESVYVLILKCSFLMNSMLLRCFL